MPVTLARRFAASRITRCTFALSFALFLSLNSYSIPAAAAQDAPRGLSQLDFDTPAVKRPNAAVEALSAEPELTPEQIRALVTQPSAAVDVPTAPADPAPLAPALVNPSPPKPALKPATEQHATIPNEAESARAQLGQPRAEPLVPAAIQVVMPPENWTGPATKFEWTRAEDSTAHYLPPRLKGPSADKAAPTTITTDASWAKQDDGCQEPKDLRAVCAKSKSLKELFFRFSGSDDVFSSQCAGFSCPDPSHEARLTGFAIAPKKGGEFRMLAVGNSCHYQLEAPQGPTSWVMLEGVRGSCSCVPKSCS